jgi:hypothetical protein
LNEMVLPANGRMEKEMKQLKMNKMWHKEEVVDVLYGETCKMEFVL